MDDLDADAIQRLVADIPSQSARLEIEKFLREYHRLKKTLARLVKHADRTEKKLEQAATEAAREKEKKGKRGEEKGERRAKEICSVFIDGTRLFVTGDSDRGKPKETEEKNVARPNKDAPRKKRRRKRKKTKGHRGEEKN